MRSLPRFARASNRCSPPARCRLNGPAPARGVTVPRARIIVALLAVVTLVHAQDQPPRPTFRTEANYVRVDAYPTKGGAPVADLTREEFEILDSGQPQKIEQFERVVIRAAGSQESRIEPNTVAESRSMVESPRARVFVLFLD